MTIFTNNLRRLLRKPSSWVYLILIPVVINVFVVGLSIQQAQWVIGVHDSDDTRVTQQFVDSFGADGKIVVIEDPATVTADLDDARYDIAIDFPAGYTQDVIDGNSPVLEVVDRGDNNQTDSLKVEFSSHFASVNALGVAADGDQDAFFEAFGDYVDEKFTADYLNFDGGSTEEASRTIVTLGYLSFGITLMMSSVGLLLLTDRLRGVFDRAQLTPLTKPSYFGQYFLSMLVIAVAQLALVMVVLPIMAPVSYGTTLAQTGGVVLAALSFTLFIVAKSFLIHRLAKNQLVAATVSSVIDLPMLMLGGALWPRDVVPELLQQIGQFSPVWWFLDAAEHALRGADAGAYAVPVLGLLGLAVLLIVITFSVRTERVR
ncbi:MULTISPECIES: ABC transporter permease [Curtobacterium]|jgi:ABC-2 type transport system permease protein|uniref:ABC transporter permease n=1 Tax=Curtobacterium TaxID=2034 RepID=UPI000DA78CD7|nr:MULTISPECIES: ABC transporter permease [Curtobacterium]MBT1673741.1 ABC transporter permease [Curtobacterium flaccumfaciens pv. flaccumfaciens]MCS6552333.1 ABC transporter permease [Curtobacterium flaccumfaciens pv. flaccumfaciens]MDF2805178.1 transporter [Cellulosimicrobium sp.]PZE29534.1 hypothetical protein DEJ02_06485 [Curtobacterium sp. MCLR17_042]